MYTIFRKKTYNKICSTVRSISFKSGVLVGYFRKCLGKLFSNCFSASKILCLTITQAFHSQLFLFLSIKYALLNHLILNYQKCSKLGFKCSTEYFFIWSLRFSNKFIIDLYYCWIIMFYRYWLILWFVNVAIIFYLDYLEVSCSHSFVHNRYTAVYFDMHIQIYRFIVSRIIKGKIIPASNDGLSNRNL